MRCRGRVKVMHSHHCCIRLHRWLGIVSGFKLLLSNEADEVDNRQDLRTRANYP